MCVFPWKSSRILISPYPHTASTLVYGVVTSSWFNLVMFYKFVFNSSSMRSRAPFEPLPSEPLQLLEARTIRPWARSILRSAAAVGAARSGTARHLWGGEIESSNHILVRLLVCFHSLLCFSHTLFNVFHPAVPCTREVLVVFYSFHCACTRVRRALFAFLMYTASLALARSPPLSVSCGVGCCFLTIPLVPFKF